MEEGRGEGARERAVVERPPSIRAAGKRGRGRGFPHTHCTSRLGPVFLFFTSFLVGVKHNLSGCPLFVYLVSTSSSRPCASNPTHTHTRAGLGSPTAPSKLLTSKLFFPPPPPRSRTWRRRLPSSRTGRKTPCSPSRPWFSLFPCPRARKEALHTPKPLPPQGPRRRRRPPWRVSTNSGTPTMRVMPANPHDPLHSSTTPLPNQDV